MARCARSLDVLLDQLNHHFPGRSTASDGWIGDTAHQARSSDHNPDAAGVVHARDFTHDPARGMDINRLTDELVASRDPRIKYLIANRLFWEPSNPRWVPYTGSNPHDHHFHLSVVSGPAADDTRPWDLASFRKEPDVQLSDILRNRYGGQLTVAEMLAWIDWHTDQLDKANLPARVAAIEAKLDQLLAAVAAVTGGGAAPKA